MRKFFYAILCMFMNIKSAFHCWRCGFSCNELNVRTELVDLREAFHLLSMGFEPVQVDYTNNGTHDTFYFRRSAMLLMALDTYRKAIRTTVNAVDYDDLTAVCTIPGSQISPIDDKTLENVIASRGHVREAFAYMSWPVETRQAYIAANADTRRRMVDDAYRRG